MGCRTRFFAIVAALLALGLVQGCSRQPQKKAPRPPDVTVITPLKRDVPRFLEYTGTTQAVEYVDIRARVSGFLQKICFEPRAKVKTGQLLFVIDPRQYQATVDEAKGKLDAAKAQAKLAETEVQIARQLESQEAISALKLDKKAAERDVAQANVELAKADLERAKLNLEWTQVMSPISGRVSRNLVDAGNLVGATEKTLLTTVLNDDPMYVYFNLSELDLLPIIRSHTSDMTDAGVKANRIPVSMGLADEEGFPHKGYVDFADTKLDPSTGTIQVRGVFDNPDGLLMAGMFVRVRAPVETRSVYLIPDDAVQFDQGGRYVLIVTPENVVERRSIKIAEGYEHMRVVEEGLTDKDRVIVTGVQRARPGAKVNPITQAAPAIPPDASPEAKKQAK